MKQETTLKGVNSSNDIVIRRIYAAMAELDFSRVAALLTATSFSDVFIKPPPLTYLTTAGILLEAPVEVVRVLRKKLRADNLTEKLSDRRLIQAMLTHAELHPMVSIEMLDRLLEMKKAWPDIYIVTKAVLLRLVKDLAATRHTPDLLLQAVGRLITKNEIPLLEDLVKAVFQQCSEDVIRKLDILIDRRQSYIIRDLQWCDELTHDQRILAYHMTNDPVDANPEPQDSFGSSEREEGVS